MTYVIFGIGVLAVLVLVRVAMNMRSWRNLERNAAIDPLCLAMLTILRDEAKDGMVVSDIMGRTVRTVPGATYKQALMAFSAIKALELIVAVGTAVPSGTPTYVLSALGLQWVQKGE
jgi:hypothetical protein